jgi:hypothetical protein
MAYWTLFIACLVMNAFVVAAWVFHEGFRSSLKHHSENNSANLFGLSVQGAAIIVIILSLLAAAAWAASMAASATAPRVSQVVDPAERCVTDFYASLNEGIGGSQSGFERAVSLMTPNQRNRRSNHLPGNPVLDGETFGRLYKSSGAHRLIDVAGLSNRSDDSREFLVIYALNEPHPENPLYAAVAPTTLVRANQFFSLDSKLDSITNDVMGAIEKSFDVQASSRAQGVEESSLRSDLEKSIKSQFMNRLFGHRLVTELATVHGLSRREINAGDAELESVKRYDVIECRKITVVRVKGQWLIDRNVTQGTCAVPVVRE